VPLTRDEVRLRASLPRRVTARALYDAALASGWSTVAQLAELAGVPGRRRAEVELAELVAGGWLVRHERGARNQARLVRYEPRVAAIGADRTPPYFAGASDPEIRNRQTDRGGGPQRPAPARDRPAELRNALVDRVCQRWHLGPGQVTPGLMRLLGAGATDRELADFLADAERGRHPAFGGVDERQRFGCSCTAERFRIWRESRQRRPAVEAPEPPPEPDALSLDELGRRAEAFRRSLGRVAADEPDAIAELVRREASR